MIAFADLSLLYKLSMQFVLFNVDFLSLILYMHVVWFILIDVYHYVVWIDVSIQLLIDIWVVSSLGRLWVILLWTSFGMIFKEYIDLLALDKYLGVWLLDLNVSKGWALVDISKQSFRMII